MKTITFLLLVSISLVGFSQENSIDLKTENLKGNVLSFQNKTFILDKDSGDEALKYNEKYIFDKSGSIISIENFGTQPTLISKDLFVYKNGRLVTVTTYNSTGSTDKSTQYEYDDTGKIEAQKKMNSSGKLQYHTTYLYNKAGQLAGQHKLIPSINYTMKENYAYNSKGQLLEKAKIARIGTTKETYAYNEVGLMSKKSEYNAMGELFSVIAYQYNDYDDKIDLKKYDATGSLNYFEKYEYVYDSKGNWIERTSFEKGEKVSVEKRKITYRE